MLLLRTGSSVSNILFRLLDAEIRRWLAIESNSSETSGASEFLFDSFLWFFDSVVSVKFRLILGAPRGEARLMNPEALRAIFPDVR